MPYIKSDNDRRRKLRKGEPALTAGELNYQIFYYVKYNPHILYQEIKKYVDNFLGLKPNYQKYNDMTGCLVRCAREIKRRLGSGGYVLIGIMDSYDDEIAKYEDKKIHENGDV